MASSVPPTSSQPPPLCDEPASLLDLPAHVLSTHILPRLPASAVGRFACVCKLARDAAGEDERLWRLLCARRLERWCPGAADVPPEGWKLPPRRRRRRQQRQGRQQQQPAPRSASGLDSETSDDEEYEQEGDEEGSREESAPPPPPPSYRELYCRLLGWGVPGAMLGPVAASADAALGLAPQSEDERGDPPPSLSFSSSSSSSSSSSRRAQDPLYWRETRRETAARRPLGSLLSFEPDPRTGSVVGYALSAPLEMSAGFLRTPLFEFVPSRRVGRRPRQRCLRFPQQAGDSLARARRDDAAAAAAATAAAAPSARRRRARRHFEPHRARFSLLWETPRQEEEEEEEEGGETPDCRDAFDLACQASLEAEAMMRGVEGESSEGEGGAEGLRFFSGLSLSSSRSSPSSSSSSSSASPPFPRRPAVLLGPCEAWCRQTFQEVACRTAAFVDSMQLPPPRGPQRRQQQRRPRGGGGGGEADEEEEVEEEGEGEQGGESEEDDGAHFSRGVAPAVPGIGRAAPPLDRLGDGCCGTARGTAGGGGRGGVSALPRLSRTRSFEELLHMMEDLDMTTVGRAEGEEEGETVSYTPVEGLGLVPPPLPPPPRGEIAGAGVRAGGGDKVDQGTGDAEAAPSHSSSSSSSSSSPAQSQLEGVWKGDYGSHGVEVVRISRFAGPAEVDSVLPVPGSRQFEEVGGGRRGRDASLLAAIKLSGDTDVPAGAVSFALGTSPLDCAARQDYLTFAGVLPLNGGYDTEIEREINAVFGFGQGLADSDLLRLSDRADGGLGAPLSRPYGWHCEHELETADPTPLSVRGHWPAAALVAHRGFLRPKTVPAQVVSVSRDCFFVAWGRGICRLSLFTRVYRSEMEWAGPEGAR